MIILRFIAVLALAAAFAAPASAQEQQQISVSDAVRKGQTAYIQALQRLTPAQRDELKEYDEKLGVIMQPVLETYETGGKLIYCLQHHEPISTAHESYVKAFQSYRAREAEEAEKQWQEPYARAMQLGYIDRNVVSAHFAFLQAVQTAVVRQTIEQNGKSGGYKSTDCAALQRLLDGAKEKDKALPDGATFDGSSGTLGKSGE